MEDVIAFQVKRVGGPFDGDRGLRWHDDGDEWALPEQMLVARCSGYGECGLERLLCVVPHLVAWDAAKVARAPVRGAAQYSRVDMEVVEHGRGVATYVHADLDLEGFVEDAALAGIGVTAVVFDEYRDLSMVDALQRWED